MALSQADALRGITDPGIRSQINALYATPAPVSAPAPSGGGGGGTPAQTWYIADANGGKILSTMQGTQQQAEAAAIATGLPYAFASATPNVPKTPTSNQTQPGAVNTGTVQNPGTTTINGVVQTTPYLTSAQQANPAVPFTPSPQEMAKLATLTPIIPQTTKTPYSVQAGSNLTASAKAMGITLTELLDANPQYKANPSSVQAGAKLNYPIGSQAGVTDTSSKNAQIQAVKDNIARLQAEVATKQQEELASKTTEAQTATAQSIIDKLKTEAGTPPDPYSSADLLKTLQSEQGTTAIQEHINIITAEINTLEANYKAGKAAQGNELAPMDLITSRQRELGEQYNEKLDTLQNNKKALIDEYNMKVGNINDIMAAKKQDYDTSKAAYDEKFSQAIQMMTLTNSMENTAADNVRADWSAYMGMLKGTDTSNMSDEMKLSLATMEAKMGAPAGISQYVLDTQAEGVDILSQSVVNDSNGNPIGWSLLEKDAKGNITMRTVGFSAGSGAANAETGNGGSGVTSSTGSYEDIAQEAINADASPQQALNEAINMADMRGITLSKKDQDALYTKILKMKKVTAPATTTTETTTTPTPATPIYGKGSFATTKIEDRIAELKRVLGANATSQYLLSTLTSEGYNRNEVMKRVGNIVDKAQDAGSNLLNFFTTLFK